MSKNEENEESLIFIPEDQLFGYADYIISRNKTLLSKDNIEDIVNTFKKRYQLQNDLLSDDSPIPQSGYLVTVKDIQDFPADYINIFLAKTVLRLSNSGHVQICLDENGEFRFPVTEEGAKFMKETMNKLKRNNKQKGK